MEMDLAYGMYKQVITDYLLISHTGTITKLPDAESNSQPVPTVGSETSHTSLPIKIALPLVSVILLTLLGVILIIANIYKARKDKKKSPNPLESLT